MYQSVARIINYLLSLLRWNATRTYQRAAACCGCLLPGSNFFNPGGALLFWSMPLIT